MYMDTYPLPLSPSQNNEDAQKHGIVQVTDDRQKASVLMQQAFSALLEHGEPMLSQDEACRALHCGPIRLHSLLASGELPGLKAGKDWVIPRRAFFERVNALSLSQALDRWRALNPDPLLDAVTTDPRLVQMQENIRLQKRGPGRPRKP